MIRVLITRDISGAIPFNAGAFSFQGIAVEFCACSGAEVLHRIRTERFDAVVITSVLPDIQLCSIVKQYELYRAGHDFEMLLAPPAPLFLALQPSVEIHEKQRLLKAGYCAVLSLPVSEYRLCEEMLDKLGPVQMDYCEREMQLRLTVHSILLDMGIPRQLKGFVYLSECLVYLAADPDALFQATKVLYPQVARRMQTSAFNLERSMRTALKKIGGNGSGQAIEKYLAQNGIHNGSDHIHVTDLLGRLLHYIQVHRNHSGL